MEELTTRWIFFFHILNFVKVWTLKIRPTNGKVPGMEGGGQAGATRDWWEGVTVRLVGRTGRLGRRGW